MTKGQGSEKERGSVKEEAKKQVLLRMSPTLWNDINQWAQDDFRSINGQIEFLLSQAVQKHKKSGADPL